MLASHKKGDQNMGNLVVGERGAIAVLLLHQGAHDIVLTFLDHYKLEFIAHYVRDSHVLA